MNFDQLKDKDWFYDFGFDEYQRPIVYVHYMNIEIIKFLQITYGNVFIYFASYKLLSKNDYINHIDVDSITERDPLSGLLATISQLKSFYDKSLLENIFFEVHDGKNAITDYSMMVPQLRGEIEKLYSIYGFDILYKKLL
jgi:hypothetical protein